MKNKLYPISVLLFVALFAVLAGFAQIRPFPNQSSFMDPTAQLINIQNIHFGKLVYIAPFALLRAGHPQQLRTNSIHVGNETNIQDSVTVDSTLGEVRLGDMTILAHGATVRGYAEIGESGSCHAGEPHCPSFVGFNSLVESGIVQKDAMVLHLARVGPGITIPSGCMVLSGKNITDQSQVGKAPVCNPPYTAPVGDAQRHFMEDVVHVNVCFAGKYTDLALADPDNVFGINYDPDCSFNPGNQLPIIFNMKTQDPQFRNRIIGDVRLQDTMGRLDQVMANKISLRADEGAPFFVGTILKMDSRTTFHALEHNTGFKLGDNGIYGKNSLVHGGGPTSKATVTGDNFTLGNEAVFFNSQAGIGVSVGCRSLVQGAELASGTIVPNFTVIIGNQITAVEWGTCP